MTAPTQCWTYHVLRVEGPIDASHLNTLGKQAWELVVAVPDPGTGATSLVFKRPAPDFRTRITLDQRAVATGTEETSR